MYSRKQLAIVIDQILTETDVVKEVDSSTVDDYNKLNDKCDIVIDKIKSRKGKKSA